MLTSRVAIDSIVVDVEGARTEDEYALGNANRTEFGDGEGRSIVLTYFIRIVIAIGVWINAIIGEIKAQATTGR